jgi:hypothetical protein
VDPRNSLKNEQHAFEGINFHRILGEARRNSAEAELLANRGLKVFTLKSTCEVILSYLFYFIIK